MTDAELVELAIRRTFNGTNAATRYWLIKVADEIAALVAERTPQQSQPRDPFFQPEDL